MISNTEKGKEFQLRARAALRDLTGLDFEMEVKLPIGKPAKLHPFDLATPDRRFVGECKAFTFTKSGNNPSAKITTLREAALYLRQLPPGSHRFIVMKRDVRPGHAESLAEQFARLNAGLLEDVVILELSEDGAIRSIHGNL